jgi:hypothetical protein
MDEIREVSEHLFGQSGGLKLMVNTMRDALIAKEMCEIG